MHRTVIRCLAQGAPNTPMGEVQAAAKTLMPPIPLYRALLRAHRNLPPEMRSLGDDYVKSEFRRHQKIDNPLQIVGFCSQWKMYLDSLHMDQFKPGGSRGQALDPKLIDKLYELKLAASEVFDPERAQARPPPKKDESDS
ncbi:hypothetical protein MBRA1_000528 [Malassezia brasiliensis]|uniref:Succinate dehydrogenase assembly factor 3 n=1 Tax=Malassezia brasiliensis TaxID=1821822 RepID=A0AAF0IME8_9BASI|nr:hypothetical protein MBRA1_000528 [Malassezia brasiliensis]